MFVCLVSRMRVDCRKAYDTLWEPSALLTKPSQNEGLTCHLNYVTVRIFSYLLRNNTKNVYLEGGYILRIGSDS